MFTSRTRERKKRIDARYEISDQGVVYGDGLPLKAIAGIGVNMHGERKKIAYLVARAFVPNQECRPYVWHKNGDPTDNRAENLEWREFKEEKPRGRKSKGRMVAQYSRDGERKGLYASVKDAERESGVKEGTIRAALAGRLRSAGGFLWTWL